MVLTSFKHGFTDLPAVDGAVHADCAPLGPLSAVCTTTQVSALHQRLVPNLFKL